MAISAVRERLIQSLVLFSILSSSLWAQNLGKDPVGFLYSPEAQSLGQSREHVWLDDGNLLHWEYSYNGLFRQGIMRWDKTTGTNSSVLKTRDVQASVQKLGLDPNSIQFPDAFSPKGDYALYEVDGDLVVCKIPGGEAVRLTETPDVEEKSPRFSPDGKKIAYVVANDLYAVEIATGKTLRLTTDATETLLNGTLSWVYWEEIFGRQDTGYWWSPDSSQIAFLRTDESQVGIVPIIDWEPDYPEIREQRYPRTGTVNPKVEVCVVDLKEEAQPRTLELPADSDLEEYVIRVNWMPRSKGLIVQTMNRAQNKVALQKIDLNNKDKSTLLFVESDAGWVHPHDDLVIAPKEDRFLWVSERDGWAHAYLYGMDGKLIRQVTRGKFALRSASELYWLRQAIQYVDWDSNTAYVQSLEKSSIENHLYRVNLENGEMARVTPEDGTHVVSFSKTGEFFIDSHSQAHLPPLKQVRKLDGEVVASMGERRTAALEAREFVYPEFFKIAARDGFKMPAYIFKPKDFDETRAYPVVIYGYGGPAAPSVADKWDGNDLIWANILTTNGFIVFCVDNRSAAAISKLDENTILNQMYGDGEVNDLLDGVAWLKSQPYVDGDRVGLWGWSGGGSLTLLGMTNSKEFKAGIAVAGVTRWQYYDTLWAEASLKKPQDNAAGYRRCDLAAQAGNLSGKLLLVHGTSDDNVHVQNAYAFADGLIEAGKLFEMMIYPNRDHSIRDLAARKHLYNTMLDFWRRNLKN